MTTTPRGSATSTTGRECPMTTGAHPTPPIIPMQTHPAPLPPQLHTHDGVLRVTAAASLRSMSLGRLVTHALLSCLVSPCGVTAAVPVPNFAGAVFAVPVGVGCRGSGQRDCWRAYDWGWLRRLG